MDKGIAARLAEETLAEWRAQASYSELADMDAAGEKRATDVVAEDGRRYSVVAYTIDDGGGIRMVVAVDDGGMSAWSPLTRDEIMRPDGSFVD